MPIPIVIFGDPPPREHLAKKQLLAEITTRYLTSGDFNGYSISPIMSESGEELKALVREGLVSLVFGEDRHPNAFIRAFGDEEPNILLEKLDRFGVEYACAYPTRAHLEKVVDRNKYEGKPYALDLALGAPQLTHCAFDLQVLENYRNDPRYSYECDDISGTLSGDVEDGLLDKDSGTMRFGFAYDDEKNRYVAAFNWDLFKLPPKHQQIWRARQLAERTRLHPDFFRSQILGDWPRGIAVYEAVVREMAVINEMAVAMGRSPFFRETYEDNRPREFASLLRPTEREFNAFVKLLDAMLSDNINLDFFQNEVARETERERSDGKIEVRPKGSIQLFEEWVRKKFRTSETERIDAIFATFREVRKLRNKPSHTIRADQFSKEIGKTQRELMVRAYEAILAIRLMFSRHPKARGVKVPTFLGTGEIWLE